MWSRAIRSKWKYIIAYVNGNMGDLGCLKYFKFDHEITFVTYSDAN